MDEGEEVVFPAMPRVDGGTSITLPYPPAANNLYAVVRGRKILSAAGRIYQQTVRKTLMEQRTPPFMPDARIAYELQVFPPDKRRRDLSNVLKAFEDALTKAGIWGDDSQVDYLVVRRMKPHPGGQLIVNIRGSLKGWN